MMTKYLLLLICFVMHSVSTVAQEEQEYELRLRALEVGEYDFSKYKKHYTRVLYGEEANEAFKKRIMGDKEAMNYFLGIPSLPDPEIDYATEIESEVFAYFPDDDIVFINTPVCLWAADIKNRRDGTDPTTYAYSPSGKYRFSYFVGDGDTEYFLEEKVGDAFYLKSKVYILGNAYASYCNFYWVDEETVYFLKEKLREDGAKYWLGYYSKFYLRKPKLKNASGN